MHQDMNVLQNYNCTQIRDCGLLPALCHSYNIQTQWNFQATVLLARAITTSSRHHLEASSRK